MFYFVFLCCASAFIIFMTDHYRQSIKRSRTYRQSSLKQAFMLNDTRSRKNSMIELSVKIQDHHIMKLQSNRKKAAVKKHLLNDSHISQHPFSFYSHKKEHPEQFKSNEQAHAFVYVNYDIMDLSYSLISSDISSFTLFFLYMILVIIRYGSLFCLVYITAVIDSTRWQWIFSIIITYVIYFIAMIKVSLRPAQNKCETILKLVFDSLQSNEVVEYFQIIEYKKLFQSVMRALVPPQFSFLYIWKSCRTKRVQVYSMVNYIYASMEAVIYYPFFVIYTSMYFKETLGMIQQNVYMIVMGSIVIAQCIFLSVTMYLVLYGCKKRGYRRRNKQNV